MKKKDHVIYKKGDHIMENKKQDIVEQIKNILNGYTRKGDDFNEKRNHIKSKT